MNQEKLTKAIKELAKVEGADLVGIAPISRYDNAPEILRPQAHLPEAQSVIVMAVHHTDASIDWGGEPNSNWAGPFQVGMIPKLDTMALRIARFVEKQGYAAVPLSCTFFWRHRPYKSVPFAHAASFSHMNAFVAAGLGEYGWHGMVMSPQYGPRQRIISVITSAPLVPDPLYTGEALCDRCNQCERACYGHNYKPEHLLSSTPMGFTIEGKKFEYANINRWRCFWGEQCHLDMNKLPGVKDVDEAKIYQEMDNGVTRAGFGYMCASFKHCMAKPLRKWDRSYTAGPRRKKDVVAISPAEVLKGIIAKAKAAGADRLSIQPLAKFESTKGNFYEGFRVDDMFNRMDWVITIGRQLPAFLINDNPLAKNNGAVIAKNYEYSNITRGRMMIGTVDITRYLDDLGFEALQVWKSTGIGDFAANMAEWKDEPKGVLVLESIVCKAPLAAETLSFPCPLDDLKPEDIPGAIKQRLPQIDLLGTARIEDLQFDDGKELKKLVPNAKTIIALGVGLPKRVVELAGAQEAECAVSYQYVNYQATREAVWAAQDIASSLSARGYFAVPLLNLEVNSVGQPLPYIELLPDLRAQSPFAAATGIGTLGKNGFLMTPEFGPRQRLAFVLTDAELPATPKSLKKMTCPDGCKACVSGCPVQALKADKIKTTKIIDGSEFPVFERNEVRCQWARCMGMVAEEGSSLLGWKLPDLDIPDNLDAASTNEALFKKDPIQVRCYHSSPNHSDTQVERCLQACPLGRK
jgi:epoxyqueuosine reductase QueG